VELCRQRGWPVHCGSEDDVLGRTLEAASAYSPRVIVDVTSDCPFADPRHINLLVSMILRNGVDYASNIEPRTWPDGLDVQVYKMKSLIRIAESNWAIREHSGWNITQAPKGWFSRAGHNAVGVSNKPHWRLTLDTAADLKVLRACYDHYVRFYSTDFQAGALVHFLNTHRELLTNSEVKSTTPGVI